MCAAGSGAIFFVMVEHGTWGHSAARDEPESDDGWPQRYRIVVKGVLDPRWSDRLAGMVISPQEGAPPDVAATVLEGPIRDRSELNGLLNTLSDVQFTLVSVELIDGGSSETPPDPESAPTT